MILKFGLNRLRLSRNPQHWLFLGVIAMIYLPWRAEAAESVVLKYSILQETISVDELSTLANTGESSPSLKAYLKMANKQPEELQKVLTRKVEVDPVILSEALNTFPGELLLDQVGRVIHTPSGRASRESLRGALVTSALPDGNIRLIELLENYPTAEVYVEGDRLAEIYQQIDGAIGNLPHIGF
ncbi:MAG: alpha/beta hydrolase [Microcystaceae cyanobacterium]